MRRLCMILAMLLMTVGCGDSTALTVEPRTAAIDWRSNIYSDSALIEWEIKWTELQDIVEISDAAVIARVDGLTSASLTQKLHDLYFTYELEIGEVLFDTTGTLTSGGKIAMSSGEGAHTLAELKPKLDYTGSVYIPKYQGEHPDSDWVLAAQHLATPIEVGRTYLLFIDEGGEDAIWIENGREFLWETADGMLIKGDGLSKWRDAYSLNEVRGVIAARTGRCDEIGEQAYISEVKAREAAELAAAQEALRARMDAAAAGRTGKPVKKSKRRMVYTAEYDRYAGDTLEKRLADCNAAVIVTLTAREYESEWASEWTAFHYDAEIAEILYDPDGLLTVGKSVWVQMYSGVAEAWRVQEEIGFRAESIRDGILQDGYTDRDYAAVMTPGTIPAEDGGTYFMLLGKTARDGYWDYYDCSGAYFYEYSDGKLYTGDGRKNRPADIRLDEIKKAIDALG